MSRPDRDTYFMGFARQAGTRATCDRGKSGAVIVVQGQVVSTGYVGAAKGLDHCDEVGHLFRRVIYLDESVRLEEGADRHDHIWVNNEDEEMYAPNRQHCMRTAHAEGNAIVQAAKLGNAINGGTMYCKMEPCLRCCVDIINCGIKRVVAEFKYHGAGLTREWFEKAGVELVVLNDKMASYDNRPKVTRDPKFGTKQFAVCHWDTFDNETFLKAEFDTLEECDAYLVVQYGDRIRHSGADKVQVVDYKGDVVRNHNVG